VRLLPAHQVDVAQITAALAALVATTEYHAVCENVQPADQLDANAFAGEPALRVAYDEARAMQRLTWRGLLMDAPKQALNATVNSPVLADLLDAVQSQGRADAEALLNGALALAVGTLEFTAVEDNVQASDQLDPNSFEPRIRVAYEEGSQGGQQRLTLQGLLSDAKRTQLEAANPSVVLVHLLDAVQSQSDALIQQLRVGLFASSDFDALFAQLAARSDTNADPRARLLKAVTPFIMRKLTRQLVVQTVAASLGTDRDFTEALMTDGSLLVDPTQPDSTLVDGFTAAGDQGIAAAFFAASDGSGNPLETRLVSTADTADRPSGVSSARFEGYLQVPGAGPYRFFAVSTLQNAEVELRFGDRPDPLLQGKAATNDAEISAFVDLKPGIIYHFSFTANNLNGGTPNDGNASLLVQGENLPKGTLARLTMYPTASVERVQRAHVLLAKSLQLIDGLGLTQREVRHMLTHAADFDDISFNKLPTRDSDASSVQATALFGYFLRLVAYTRLKREAAGETDDLIDIFEHARHTDPALADANLAKAALLDDLCQRFADLTRRDFDSVRQTAASLGFDSAAHFDAAAHRAESAEFAQERGIRRLWDALQIVETFGVAVAAIIGATEIISTTKTAEERFTIASALRHTVKARYEPENWQRVAQPIFDQLRQRQRDALVAHIMHRNGFERIEQLFGYIPPFTHGVFSTTAQRMRRAVIPDR